MSVAAPRTGGKMRAKRLEAKTQNLLFDNDNVPSTGRMKGDFWRLKLDFPLTRPFTGFKLMVIEVLTSVPPDPVSIVHCRHWVFSLSSPFGSRELALPAGTLKPPAYR